MTLSAAAADAANRAAAFHPMTLGTGLPMTEVAGAAVFAYFDADGTLRVSVHLEDVADGVADHRGNVPMRVTIGDTVVFSG